MTWLRIAPTAVGTVSLMVDDRYVTPDRSQKVWNHSPDGFQSGYYGSGPAQLALAILLEFTDEATAVRLHQTFKSECVAKWHAPMNIRIDMEQWIKEHME